MRVWFISCKMDNAECSAQKRVPASLFFFTQKYFAVDPFILTVMEKKLPKNGEEAYLCQKAGAWEYMIYSKDTQQIAVVADTKLNEEQILSLWKTAAPDKDVLLDCLDSSWLDALPQIGPKTR